MLKKSLINPEIDNKIDNDILNAFFNFIVWIKYKIVVLVAITIELKQTLKDE